MAREHPIGCYLLIRRTSVQQGAAHLILFVSKIILIVGWKQETGREKSKNPYQF